MKILKRLFARKPDFTIGRTDDVYMRRWYVIPRNRWFNIYLHNIMCDDDTTALHDHPWWNISIVLKGGYWEVMPSRTTGRWDVEQSLSSENMGRAIAYAYQPSHRRVWREPGSIIVRRAIDAHRLELKRGGVGEFRPITSWSLFITGRNVRTWGFWYKDGWVPHTTFVKKNEQGNEIGAGCGEFQDAAP